MKQKEYVLGSRAEELARLEFQHSVWAREQRALCQRAGIGAGSRVMDLGSGPGFTSFELASIVGPTGRVLARDQSAEFLGFLAAERDRRGLGHVEVSEGPVEELELPAASLDFVYARWLFCWLPDPGQAVERVSRFLRPGGAIVMQEYLDWGAMKLAPREPKFDRLVEACLESWRLAKADMNVAEKMPAFAARAGLTVEHFQIVPRLGRPGSPEWGWLYQFYETYASKLVPQGLLTAAEYAEGFATLQARPDKLERFCITPTMADLVLRKPGPR